MHTTPLWIDRDEDLRQAVHAVDPEDETIVMPVAPSYVSTRAIVLAAVAALVGLGALALLVAAVVSTSNGSTTMVTPPLAPVTKTSNPQIVSIPPSPVAPPPTPLAVETPPPTAVESVQKMAPRQNQTPIRDQLRELFPRLFP